MLITGDVNLIELSIQEAIQFGGIFLILALLFLETGLLIGLLLPVTDALLFAAGLLAGTKVLNLPVTLLVILSVFAAFIGDLTGYTIGRNMGRRFFRKSESFFFKFNYLKRAQKLYRKHGAGAIIIGRFIPIVRTINPISCGALNINFLAFFIRTGIGCIAHVSSIILVSYYLGKKIPQIGNLVIYIIPLFLLVMVVPLLYRYFVYKKEQEES